MGNALFGQAFPGDELDLLSPCNTSDGWLRKKWKIINGKRCLLKSGSKPFQQEPLNEVLATSLHQRLNNTDRHFGNFGAVRNVDTLTWLGAAPVFDSGTSLWHDQVSMVIHLNGDVPSHPFKSAHAEQIDLASSLDWIDFSTLQDIDDEFRILLSASPYIDEPRTDKFCKGLKGRVRQLEQLALNRNIK